MANQSINLGILSQQLEDLLKKHDAFSRDIADLKKEIEKLQKSQGDENKIKKELSHPPKPEAVQIVVKKEAVQISKEVKTPKNTQTTSQAPPVAKSNIEKYIGENLSNKIGIIILIIGVAIGVKYTIDNNLISPLGRVILGYLSGFIILGFGLKLRKKYTSFSAVLVSGAMVITYMMSYISYDFYHLFPQFFSLTLMGLITILTVYFAISYNRQVIAQIGLVGAYTLPFLLDYFEEDRFLLTYMAIINTGILAVAVKRYWKPLYYSSFIITWLIFSLWYFVAFGHKEISLALTFLSIFFTIFYLSFLGYKFIKREPFNSGDIFLLLANSFIFFGIGYSILNNNALPENTLGAFAISNAILHFLVSLIAKQQNLNDQKQYQLTTTLVIFFLTIAIPLIFQDHWITSLWMIEAIILVAVGRFYKLGIYESLSYLLLLLAFGSLVSDWTNAFSFALTFNPESVVQPFLNNGFYHSILFTIGLGLFYYLFNHPRLSSALPLKEEQKNTISYLIPMALVGIIFWIFRTEIANYWNAAYINSFLTIQTEGQQFPSYFRNNELLIFKDLTLLQYGLVFFSVLTLLNVRRFKNQLLGVISISILSFIIFLFLIYGLYLTSELQEAYLAQTLSEYYPRTAIYINIRYLSFVLVTFAFYAFYKNLSQDYIHPKIKIWFDIMLHTTILWIASNEMLIWVADSNSFHKLGLSILWGIYSLGLVGIGIWRKLKHLRIGGMVLFGAILLKLFFYDLLDFDTIAKTIVFVSLGVFLLIISFLYNKYKHLISEELA